MKCQHMIELLIQPSVLKLHLYNRSYKTWWQVATHACILQTSSTKYVHVAAAHESHSQNVHFNKIPVQRRIWLQSRVVLTCHQREYLSTTRPAQLWCITLHIRATLIVMWMVQAWLQLLPRLCVWFHTSMARKGPVTTHDDGDGDCLPPFKAFLFTHQFTNSLNSMIPANHRKTCIDFMLCTVRWQPESSMRWTWQIVEVPCF